MQKILIARLCCLTAGLVAAIYIGLLGHPFMALSSVVLGVTIGIVLIIFKK